MDPQALLQERLHALRDGFVASLPERLETMRAALRRDDRATVRHEAHRLAGTGDCYELPGLTAWGRRVEQLCRAGATLGALDAELDALAALIASFTPPAAARG